MKSSRALFVILAILTGCSRQEDPAATTETTSSAPAIAAAAPASASRDWITYNGALGGDRYSSLDEITAANVGKLQQVCAFDAPDVVSFQTGIVAVAGTLFFTAFDNTYAIDGATCKPQWKYNRPEPATLLMVNRGLGHADGRVFRGTSDGHVLGLDARAGNLLWDVAIADPKKGESVPMAPIAWQGLVFIGNAGGDNFGVSGRIYALDATSGKTVWQFNTIPDSGPARATWTSASAKNPPSGGATWTSYALDEANGILYVSSGNPAPDFMPALRPGDNLYTNSLLALEAKTGKLIAYVQPIRNDFHDWDLSAAPALFTNRSGRASVAAAAKDGYIYNIDRTAVKSSAGSEPDAQALVVRGKALTTTRENAETPLSAERMTRFCPGIFGGIEWNGPAYHPELGLLYANSIDWCTSVRLKPFNQVKGAPGTPWTGAHDPEHPFGVLDPIERSRGWITAVDAESGEVRWKVAMPKPMVAGITATAGGLVFTGDLDGNVLAYDAARGKELWRSATGKAIGGGVITYQANGRQHLAVAAGLNSPLWQLKGGAAQVAVYALP
jgi:PQQ-dependent dehydrogenase (methanol/ethanol family)